MFLDLVCICLVFKYEITENGVGKITQLVKAAVPNLVTFHKDLFHVRKKVHRLSLDI